MQFGSGLFSKVLALSLLVSVGMGISGPAEAGTFSDWLADLIRIWQGSGPTDAVSVPEPATLALFATGAAAVGLLRRRKKG